MTEKKELNEQELEKVSGGSGENSLPRHSGLDTACEEFSSPEIESFINSMNLNVKRTCGMCVRAFPSGDCDGDVFCSLGR